MSDLDVLTADGNSAAARRARVKLQPRDKKGRWVPTGAALLAAIRGLNGTAKKYKLKAIGGTATSKGEKNKIRALLLEDAPELGLKKNTVLEVDPKNGELESKIKLDKDFLKKKGIDPDVQHTLPKSIAEQPQDVSDMNPQAGDDLDIELANGGLTDDEDKDFRAERDEEPLAKLPPGMEDEVKTGEEVSELLDGDSDAPEKDYLQDPTPESIADDIMSEAFYNGDVPDIDEALAPLAREVSPDADDVRSVSPLDLERGSVIRSGNGDDFTVLDFKFSGDLEKAKLTLQDKDGNVFEQDVATDAPLRQVTGARRRATRPPEAEERPTPTPAEDAAPEISEEATPEPEVIEESEVSPVEVAEESLVPANFPPASRVDNGEDIDLQPLDPQEKATLRRRQLNPTTTADGEVVEFVDETGNVVAAQDPFNIMSALADAYPDAKFSEDGLSLIMHRQKDKDGRIFELRANNTGKRAILFSVKWTDPESGKSEEFIYKNDAHSISAALGAYDSEYILDKILGRTPDSENLEFGNSRANMNDTLRRRAQIAFMGPKNPADTRRKFVSLEENANRLAEGRSTTYHENSHRVKDREIPSLWGAWSDFLTNPDAANKEDLYHVLYNIFGMQPMNEAAHAKVRTQIRATFKELFPERSDYQARAFNAYVTNASEKMRGIYRNPDDKVRAIRYASKNRTTAIESGMTVEYINNVGDKSIVKVKALVKNQNASSLGDADRYNYGDYVVIEDSEGNTRLINALKLRILDDQNAPIGRYIPNLRGEALRARREEQGEISPLNSLPDRVLPATPIISNVPEGPKLIDDFIVGEVLRDREGNPIGEILSIKPIKSSSGKDGNAFIVRKSNGEKVRVNYALGTELPPKSVAPANGGPLSREIGESAPDLDARGLHPDSDPDFDDIEEDVFDGEELPLSPSEELDELLSGGDFGENYNVENFTVELEETFGKGSTQENLRAASDLYVELSNKKSALQQAASRDSRLSGVLTDYRISTDTSEAGEVIFISSELSGAYRGGSFDEGTVNRYYPGQSASSARTNLALAIYSMNQIKKHGSVENAVAANGVSFERVRNSSASPISKINIPISVNEDGSFDPAVDVAEYKKSLDKLFTDNIYSFSDQNIELSISASRDSFLKSYRDSTSGPVDEDSVKNRTLGISYRTSDGKSKLVLNDDLLSSDEAQTSFGGSPIEETIAHELGHVVHRDISPDWENEGSESSSGYKDIFEGEEINEYSSRSYAEHFGENFSRYLVTGEASDEFKDYLKKNANFIKIDINDYPYGSLFTEDLDGMISNLEQAVNGQGEDIVFKLSTTRPNISRNDYARSVAANPSSASNLSTNSRTVQVDVKDKNGRSLGGGHANIIYDPRSGKPEIHAQYLELDESIQGSGYGTTLFGGLGQMLGQNGGGRIKVQAALTNGPYTWALQGFDFEGDLDRRIYQDYTRTTLGPVLSFFKERNQLFKQSGLSSEEKLKALENLNRNTDSARVGFVSDPGRYVDAILNEVFSSLRSEGVAEEVVSDLEMLAGRNSASRTFVAAYFLNNWNLDDATLSEISGILAADPTSLTPRKFAGIGRSGSDSWTKPFKKSSSIGRFIMINGKPSWYGVQDVPDMSGDN